ncbi:MAG: GDSL-type esterase/lipase family protein [Vicinamibacterales bacterium]
MRIPAVAVLVPAFVAGLVQLHAQPRTPSPDPARFDKDIAAFEAADRATPPPAGAVLFVGSSSITNWDVAAAFPALATIRRGYGGSHVSDTLHFADRIIFPYRPKVVVFYAGDADVAAGKSARQIAADTGALVALIHRRLPAAQVLVIGTKPSPAHWAHIQTIREANRIVRTWLATDGQALFADVEPALLGTDGQPRADFYAENRLNLNERGYAAWTAAVRPLIERLAARTP